MNEKYQTPLFDEMIVKWQLDPEYLNFNTALSYIDHYISAKFDGRELVYPDLTPESE